MQSPSSIPPLAVSLSYFHTIIGPCTLYVHPSTVIGDKIIEEVACSMDKIITTGFFTQGSGIYTAVSDYFEIPSAWARGSKEVVLLSFILLGKVTPDVEVVLQSLVRNIEDQFKKTPEIYKGLYIDDESRSPEGERARIREMHQLIVSHVTRLHQAAYEAIIESWMMKKSEELLPGSLLNNPILNTACTGYGRDILAAVAQGAKTRREAAMRSGLDELEITLWFSLLLSLDLLTEGTELVLTNRGRRVLQESLKEGRKEVFLHSFLLGKERVTIYDILSAIQQGARTREELQAALRTTE
jgi:hypothetical protein